jgi:hypothetical protein
LKKLNGIMKLVVENIFNVIINIIFLKFN